jgi:hypothetical protein
MLEGLYPIISVLLISLGVFFFGGACATWFLASRWAPIAKNHPFVTRWIVFVIVVLFVFLFVKFLQPVYRGLVAGIGIVLFFWGVLSRIEKRFLWQDFFTVSFWIPEEAVSRIAKNGT